MPKRINTGYSQLLGHFNSLEYTRRKAEVLLRSGKLVRRDCELIYSGLYLDVHTSFEKFLETLFFDLLLGTIRPTPCRVHSLVVFPTKAKAIEVLRGQKKYLDWLPYQYTLERANSLFKDGIPFTSLDKSQKEKLQKILLIRNAIAHKSDHSLNAFRNIVIDTTPLTRTETTPAGFLRSVISTLNPTTKYQIYVNDIALITRDLINAC